MGICNLEPSRSWAQAGLKLRLPGSCPGSQPPQLPASKHISLRDHMPSPVAGTVACMQRLADTFPHTVQIAPVAVLAHSACSLAGPRSRPSCLTHRHVKAVLCYLVQNYEPSLVLNCGHLRLCGFSSTWHGPSGPWGRQLSDSHVSPRSRPDSGAALALSCWISFTYWLVHLDIHWSDYTLKHTSEHNEPLLSPLQLLHPRHTGPETPAAELKSPDTHGTEIPAPGKIIRNGV